MSKRNRKKFKKLARAQFERSTSEQKIVTEQPEISATTAPVKQTDLEIEDAPEVKREVRKILLTTLLLVTIIVAIYIVNTKTELILTAGQFVASKLNLSI